MGQDTLWCAANEHIDRDPLTDFQALPMRAANPKLRHPAQHWELDKLIKVIETWQPLETAEGDKHKRAQEYGEDGRNPPLRGDKRRQFADN